MFNIDRHIAISAGWVAGPAFGVAMMAAPEYLHLGPIASALLFWGGIVVFFATIIVVAIVSFHEKNKQRAVIGPLILMVGGALIFCGGAAWYFWPTKSKQEGPIQRVEGRISSIPPAPLLPLTQGPSDDFLELSCNGLDSFTRPADGSFYSLEMNGSDQEGGAGFTHRFMSEFAAQSRHILPGANSNLQLCKITNHGDVPIFNLRTLITADFMNTQKTATSIGGIGIRFSRTAEINIPKVDAKGAADFYASSNSPLVVWINLPETVEIQRLGSSKRETVRFIRTQPISFTLSPKFWLRK